MKAGRLTDHEQRITRLEVTIENINQNLMDIKDAIKQLDTKLDNKIASVGNKIDNLDTKIESKIEQMDIKFDKKIDALSSKMDSNFKWLLTLYLGGYGALLAIMAKGFRWY